MTAALIVLAILFVLQTVRSWRYRKFWRSAVTINTELVKANERLAKNWHEAERDALAARMVGRAAMKCLSDDAILDEEYLDA